MVTGRKLIQEALREPMRERGWKPRAAGWFTVEAGPDRLGAIAVSTASEHAPAGTATATLHVHLRDANVEREVATLCGIQDQGYRSTTATTSIGYLMPDREWREWPVTPALVDEVAVEMAEAARDYASPYLTRLAIDSRLLLDAIKASAAYSTALGLCRVVVLLARMGELDEAETFLAGRSADLGSRADAAAQWKRAVADTLWSWLKAFKA